METELIVYECLHAVQFLPYLWGMETTGGQGRNRTQRPVLTVPMRNGNFLTLPLDLSEVSVLTVPMRNGNSKFPPTIAEIRESSYRTYEEWKPFTRLTALPVRRFLPYLWGMETNVWHILPLHHLLVLTVPMRNGNCHERSRVVVMFPFLPYLWGMETE